MGGRLDAVNIIDPDYSIITTVSLDHQEFLGNTVEEIAGEKAGILRAGRPGFYGDWPVPAAIRRAARDLGADLHCLGEQFDFTPSRPNWSWRGHQVVCDGLHYPPAATTAQLRNASVVLAAIEHYQPELLADVSNVNAVLATARPPGRFQIVRCEHEWILDVAHNPQAVETLRAQLESLPPSADTTVVIGMLGDKDLAAFATGLAPLAQRWVCCSVEDPRARSAASIATRLRDLGIGHVLESGSPPQAFERARACTEPGGRIIVCGSFRVVGPALGWLGIY
jgi:dihydrofolate synthase/folylpolyglutamate synthase